MRVNLKRDEDPSLFALVSIKAIIRKLTLEEREKVILYLKSDLEAEIESAPFADAQR